MSNQAAPISRDSRGEHSCTRHSFIKLFKLIPFFLLFSSKGERACNRAIDRTKNTASEPTIYYAWYNQIYFCPGRENAVIGQATRASETTSVGRSTPPPAPRTPHHDPGNVGVKTATYTDDRLDIIFRKPTPLPPPGDSVHIYVPPPMHPRVMYS